MAKKILKHLLIGAIFFIVLALIDGIFYLTIERPIFCIPMSGGEYEGYQGTWYCVDKFYPLVKDGEPGLFTEIRFLPFGAILTWLLLSVVSIFPLHKLWNKDSHK